MARVSVDVNTVLRAWNHETTIGIHLDSQREEIKFDVFLTSEEAIKIGTDLLNFGKRVDAIQKILSKKFEND